MRASSRPISGTAPPRGWPVVRVPACRRMAETLLEIAGLVAGYGAVTVLRGVDLAVAAGEVVAVLGSNGAGKTTLNNNVSALYRPFGGRVRFAGADITGVPPERVVAAGLVQVPEGRRIFPNL